MRKVVSVILCGYLFSFSLFGQTLAKVGIEETGALVLNSAMRRAAQLEIPLLTKVADTGLYSFQISKILNSRMWESFKKACSFQATIQECHAMIYGEPVYDFVVDKPFSPRTLYPELTYLNTSKQAQNYMLARNNRLFVQEVTRLQQTVWPNVDRGLPTLQQASWQLSQPLDPLDWMAEKVLAKQPNILFIGEVHEFPEIQESIRQFLLSVRELIPSSRPVIVLTEFLPQGYEWKLPEETLTLKNKKYYAQHDVPRYLQEDYRFMWDDLVQENIRVIGLEPSRVIYDGSKMKYASREGVLLKREMWTTLEGMRMRNQTWQQTIEKYRKENPEAFFIIYTGAAHSLYNAPSSISDKYPNAFVLAFYPAQRVFIKTDDDTRPVATTTPLTDPLERLTNFTQAFPQTTLFLDRPELARVAGFDGRIKVEVDLTDRLRRLSKFTRGRIEIP